MNYIKLRYFIEEYVNKSNKNLLELLSNNLNATMFFDIEQIMMKLDEAEQIKLLKILSKSYNTKALDIVSNNIDKLNLDCWSNLCSNTHDKAVEIILNNINKISLGNISLLCGNPNNKVVDFIIKYLDDNQINEWVATSIYKT